MRLLSKEVVESDSEFHDLNVYPNNMYVLENGSVVHNTGFSFSKLRAANSMVKSSGGIASGPVSFMRCLAYDTKIASPLGNIPIGELVGREIPVYCWNHDKHLLDISIMKDVRKTGERMAVWELELDNGEKIKLTSNHPILQRDETYRPLMSMSVGQSLMPFGRKQYQGRQVSLGDGNWVEEYKFVAQWKYGRKTNKDEVIHHIDGDDLNSDPENLAMITRGEHSKLNKFPKICSLASRYISKPTDIGDRIRQGYLNNTTFEQRSANSKKARANSSGHYGHRHSEETKGKLRDLRQGKTYEELYDDRADEIKKKIQEDNATRARKPDGTFAKGNHKIVALRFSGYEDVYNAEVDAHHNFALSAGIFVHNCFDAVTETIKQGGRRRGANLGCMRDSHPDVFDFIDCKLDGKSFPNFNISVCLTDEFMKSLYEDGEYWLYDYADNGNRRIIEAKDLFDAICKNVWKNGEPGVIFIDKINACNPTPWLGKIEATNPCGEQPLLPYESCNLGSVDVAKFVKDGKWDLDRLGDVVRIAIRFLDNVIDVNEYPRSRIDKKTKLTRKIGLGVMGWAVALGKLGIEYDSEDACMEASKIMEFVKSQSYLESSILGFERGCYPANRRQERRNACTNTIAPTGALSLLAGTSSSIEPAFARKYTKKLHDGDVMSFSFDNNIPISTEIAPEWHVRMQAAFQRHVDNAVSKTINLPNEASIEDVRRALILSYEMSCKGTTLYRQGTRDAPLKSDEEIKECTSGRCKL